MLFYIMEDMAVKDIAIQEITTINDNLRMYTPQIYSYLSYPYSILLTSYNDTNTMLFILFLLIGHIME